MKTIEELYKEIAESKELQEELKNVSEEELEAFLKKHSCDATAKEFADYVKSQAEGEIADEDATVIAGGSPNYIPLICIKDPDVQKLV